MHPAQEIESPIQVDATRRQCDEARKLLESGAVERAIELLESIPSSERTAAVHALLGIALFRAERYIEADAELQHSLERGLGDRELVELAAIANANAITGVEQFVPERYDFDRDSLLAG